MRCPFCSHDDTQVKDSRPTEDAAAIRRRRACPACGSRASQPCAYTGKGAIKSMRLGKNHHQRQQVAQRALNHRDDNLLIDEGDNMSGANAAASRGSRSTGADNATAVGSVPTFSPC